MLAMMAKANRCSSFISAFTKSSGELTSSHILHTFRNFYIVTYFSKASSTLENINLFLTNCPLSSLDSSDQSILNAPLTIDELGEALALLAPAKSLGDKELSVEVYKRYAGVLLLREGVFFFF